VAVPRFRDGSRGECAAICGYLTVFGELSKDWKMPDLFDANRAEVEEKRGFAGMCGNANGH